MNTNINNYISKIPINLELSGRVGIKFETFDNFIRAFIPGKQVFFHAKELCFLFSGNGAEWGIVVIRFYGGSSRRPANWKEYTVRFELNACLYDLIQFFSTKLYFTASGCKTYFGAERLSFQKQFLNWDMNFGKRNKWATEREKLAIVDERCEAIRLSKYFLPANKIPPSARRKYNSHADYLKIQRKARRAAVRRGELGNSVSLSVDEIKALDPTAVAGYTGGRGRSEN